MKEEKHYCRVLTIAGSDSGGGAGIQADLKTIAAHGCYGMSVITALTAQNTLGVNAIHAVPPEFVAAQMEAVFSDIGADAVKIGMLYSPELIRTVAEKLRQFEVRHIVFDPVMVAQSGDRLARDEAVAAMKEGLIPLAEVFTPNLPEASALLGEGIHSEEEMEQAARALHSLGCANVLVKGGHLETDGAETDCRDLLYIGGEDRLTRLSAKRIATRNNHGTGCTLSSAIAANLARGMGVEEAVRRAKDYISGALQAGAAYRLGHGHGPVHHFFRFFP